MEMADIYVALRPLHILTRFLGLATISVNRSRKDITFKRIKCFSAYKITLYIFILITVALGILNNISYFNDNKLDTTSFFMHVFKMYFITISLFCIAVLNEVRSYHLSKLWKDLIRNDTQIKKRFHTEINNKQIQLYSKILIFSIISAMTCLNRYEDFISDTEINKMESLIFLVFDLCKTTTEISFNVYITIIKVRFRILNEILIRNPSKRVIEQTCKIYLDLKGTAEFINNIYSLPNLLSLALNFVLVVAKAHIIWSCLVFNDDISTGYTISLIYWTGFYLTSTFVLIIPVQLLKNQVNTKSI